MLLIICKNLIKKIFINELDNNAEKLSFLISIKKLVSKILSYVFYFTSEEGQYLYHRMRSKIKKNYILFESFHGDSISCHPYAIYRFMKSSKSFDKFIFIWSVQDPKKFAHLNKKRLIIVRRAGFNYAKYLATCEFLISNSTFPPYFNRRNNQKYINTWHGIPLKKMFMDESVHSVTVHSNSARNFLHSTHLIIENNFSADRLLTSAGVDKIISAEIYTGFSSRAYLSKSASRIEQLKKAKASKGKVVLYAPTWRGTLIDIESQILTIQSVILKLKVELRNFDVFLSIHNLAKCHFKNMELEGDITCVDDHVEINEFLSCVDVLVTDYSSIMFDAYYLDIPVLLYIYDIDNYMSNRGTYIDIKELPFFASEKLAEIIDLIKSIEQKKLTSNYHKKNKVNIFDASLSITCKLNDRCNLEDVCREIFIENNSIRKKIEKKNIVAFLGGFKPNGITSSAINFTKFFDYENYNLIVITEGNILDKDESRNRAFREIDKRTICIHKVGRMQYLPKEKNAVNDFFHSNVIDGKHHVICSAFRRETRRVLSECDVEVALDFSGYSRHWALFISCVNANRKLIFQHNDLLSEAQERFSILYGVFSTYFLYDKVVSVSKEIMLLNIKGVKLLHDGIEHKFCYLNNYIVPSEIMEKSKDGNILNIGLSSYICICKEKYNAKEILSLVPSPKKEKISFCTIGRLSPEKGHDKLIRVIKKLCDYGYPVEIYLIGSGPLEKELNSLIHEFGLIEQVYLVGQIYNPFYLLSKCDAFVLPSNYEGQPMVLLEALTLGMKVIATDIPGNRAILKYKYGLLVDNSVDGLFFGLEKYIKEDFDYNKFDHTAYINKTKRKFNEVFFR